MPRYSDASTRRLSGCDERLIRVMLEVIQHFDCTIITGHRDADTQAEMFRLGRSKVRYPNSKHNLSPSLAVDAAPYPIDWKDRERFTYFAGFVWGIATSMGVPLRWGGDWDRDTQLNDNNFDDLLHFEVVS